MNEGFWHHHSITIHVVVEKRIDLLAAGKLGGEGRCRSRQTVCTRATGIAPCYFMITEIDESCGAWHGEFRPRHVMQAANGWGIIQDGEDFRAVLRGIAKFYGHFEVVRVGLGCSKEIAQQFRTNPQTRWKLHQQRTRMCRKGSQTLGEFLQQFIAATQAHLAFVPATVKRIGQWAVHRQ